MHRRWIVLVLLSSLVAAGTACASAKDTGFPPPETSPTGSGSASTPPSPTTPVTAVTLVGKNIQWDLKDLLFKAKAKVTVMVDNQESGIPHNFAIWDSAAHNKEIFKPGFDVQGGEKKDY